MSSQLVASGTVATGGTLTWGERSTKWILAPLTAVQTTVVFDDRYTVTLPANVDQLEVEGDYQKIAVTGATVSYLIFA